MTEYLKELNPDVEGDCIISTIEDFITQQIELIKSYHLIIATDVDNVNFF